MAFDLNSLSSFVNEYADDIKLRATLGGTSLSLFGSKYDASNVGVVKVPKLSVSAVRQNGMNCTNAPSGTTTIAQASVTTCALDYFEELCPANLRGYFPSQVMTSNLLDSELPYEGQIVMGWADEVMADREELAWMGDVASGDCANGLIKQLSTDATRLHVSGYTILTINNIDEAIDAIIGALPGAVKMGNDQVYVFLSSSNFFLYQSAMVNSFGTLAVNNAPQPNANASVYTMPYLKLPKIKLVAVQALDDTDYIVAGAASNFILAGNGAETTNFDAGLSQYKDKQWLRFKAIQGVGYFFGDQIATNF